MISKKIFLGITLLICGSVVTSADTGGPKNNLCINPQSFVQSAIRRGIVVKRSDSEFEINLINKARALSYIKIVKGVFSINVSDDNISLNLPFDYISDIEMDSIENSVEPPRIFSLVVFSNKSGSLKLNYYFSEAKLDKPKRGPTVTIESLKLSCGE